MEGDEEHADKKRKASSSHGDGTSTGTNAMSPKDDVHKEIGKLRQEIGQLKESNWF